MAWCWALKVGRSCASGPPWKLSNTGPGPGACRAPDRASPSAAARRSRRRAPTWAPPGRRSGRWGRVPGSTPSGNARRQTRAASAAPRRSPRPTCRFGPSRTGDHRTRYCLHPSGSPVSVSNSSSTLTPSTFQTQQRPPGVVGVDPFELAVVTGGEHPGVTPTPSGPRSTPINSDEGGRIGDQIGRPSARRSAHGVGRKRPPRSSRCPGRGAADSPDPPSGPVSRSSVLPAGQP